MSTLLELCRSCLEPSDKMYPLEGTIINVDESIVNMLEYCISSKLDLNKNLPSLVCIQCFKTIRIAYHFLLRFQETQEQIKLRLQLQSPQEVENELIQEEYILTNANDAEYIEQEDIQSFSEASPLQIEYDFQEMGPLDNENVKVKSVGKEPQKIEEFSAIYKCPKCHNKFGHYLVFQRHIFSYNLETITCTQCTDNHIFGRDEYLTHYKKMHRFECDICNKRMSSGYGFQYHMLAHQNEKKYVCTFNGCTRSFLLKDKLKKHMLTHTEPKTYPCHLCDRVFKTSDMQRYHIRHHNGERNFLCTLCGRTFVQAVHLRYHNARKHLKEKLYGCELCGKSFYVKPALTKHLKGCTNKQNKQKLRKAL